MSYQQLDAIAKSSQEAFYHTRLMSLCANINNAAVQKHFEAKSNAAMNFIDQRRYYAKYGPYENKGFAIIYKAERVSNFRDRLEYWMKKNHLNNQTMLAKFLNQYGAIYGEKFSPAYICALLHGRYVPKNNKLAVMSKAMGVDPAWLSGYGPDEMY